MAERVFLIVLDSFGIGYAPDAELFGDAGANTLASVRKSKEFYVPCMERLGLFRIDGVEPYAEVSGREQRKDRRQSAECGKGPAGAYGRLRELSMGKDTTVGHWELAGVVSEKPLPTYPEGFPEEIIRAFEQATGRKVLCNRPYSGTEVIRDYGEEQMRTGGLIVYTSADSVFQIAAHEAVIPPEELYGYCRIARGLLTGEHGVGRVIARPFEGEPGSFVRTPRRHDFSLEPPGKTVLDRVLEAGLYTVSVGKIRDIFAGRGIEEAIPTGSNREGMEAAEKLLDRDFCGLCFVNLVDFDMKYGHRRDVDGYAAALSEFDRWLAGFLEGMRQEDVLMITADHGCDPGFSGTDHTREYVPLLIYGAEVRPENLGTGEFSLAARKVLDFLGLSQEGEEIEK